eukprot:Gb_04442 [translate_table: standard]
MCLEISVKKQQEGAMAASEQNQPAMAHDHDQSQSPPLQISGKHDPSPRPKLWQSIAQLSHFHCFESAGTEPNKRVEEEKGDHDAPAQADILHKDVADHGDCKKQKQSRGGWKAMPYIIGNETCEKLAVTGLHSNMIVYLTTKYNMKKVVATNTLNIWSGTTSLSTLVGAFLADSYLGRFRTIFLGCLAYLLGLVMLTLTALVPRLRPPACSVLQRKSGECHAASSVQFGLLVFFFAFMTMGSAGIRPCSMAFGADQFDQRGAKGKARLQSFFNWYYFSTCAALILALTVIIYIQSTVSWSLGFGICALLMLISTIFFVLGRPLYLREIPNGSPFTGFAQVIVATIRKRHLSLPSDTSQLYQGLPKSTNYAPKHCVTDQFRFLNKAAIIGEGDLVADGSRASHWRICSIEQVEELKSIIRTLPIFSCGIVNSITIAQQHTFSVLQALTMDRRLGGSKFQIPAGSFSVFSLLVLITWLPFYDKVVVRLARHFTKQSRGISMFQRMGIGFAISALSMFVAGLVEVKRRNTARSHGLADQASAIVPISAFWLLPQFCIAGLAEAFHTIGHLEFFYDQFPTTMRSTAIALSACTSALGHYFSTMIVTLVHNTTGRNGQPDWLDDNLNRGHLEYFYWLLSGMEAVNLIYFIVCARWYKYKERSVGEETDNSDVSGYYEMGSKQIGP